MFMIIFFDISIGTVFWSFQRCTLYSFYFLMLYDLWRTLQRYFLTIWLDIDMVLMEWQFFMKTLTVYDDFVVFLLVSIWGQLIEKTTKCQNNAAALTVTNFMFSHEMPCIYVWWFQFCLFIFATRLLLAWAFPFHYEWHDDVYFFFIFRTIQDPLRWIYTKIHSNNKMIENWHLVF